MIGIDKKKSIGTLLPSANFFPHVWDYVFLLELTINRSLEPTLNVLCTPFKLIVSSLVVAMLNGVQVSTPRSKSLKNDLPISF
jgi:hypothetical protein